MSNAIGELDTLINRAGDHDVIEWSAEGLAVTFGRGALDLLQPRDPFALLVGSASRPEVTALAERAHAVVRLPSGTVADLANANRTVLAGMSTLVAIGGGRIIDVAKSLASAGNASVIAVPTTLSGAEVTRFHASIAGAQVPIRPSGVYWDPALIDTLSEPDFASSLANTLAHLVEAALLLSARYSRPEAVLAGAHAFSVLSEWASNGGPVSEVAREAAAASLFDGLALDGSGLGMLHVLAQSLTATIKVPHSAVYAAILPVILPHLRQRSGTAFDQLERAIGSSIDQLADELLERSGHHRFELTETEVETAVALAMARRELGRIPPAPDQREIVAIYRAMFGVPNRIS
jgi:alcohol dehydrogenase class IV